MTTTYTQTLHDATSLDSVLVADAMHSGTVTCYHDASLSTVARLMAAHRIHAVVVELSAGDDGWALVSDLDVVGAATKGTLRDCSSAQIASTPAVFVRTSDTVARAAQLMREYETHHVIVLGASGRPVGIISTLDVADVLAELRPS
jgi:CBS domain-containing protein